MAVRIRLQRIGRRNLPLYRIVAANEKTRRDGRYLERLGNYNPIPDPQGKKHITLNFERVKYWVGVGAQPSDTVARLLSKVLQVWWLMCCRQACCQPCRIHLNVSPSQSWP
jgi:small subunit ribosomal protein S16